MEAFGTHYKGGKININLNNFLIGISFRVNLKEYMIILKIIRKTIQKKNTATAGS